MVPDLFGNSTLPVLESVVQFAEARHGVLAGNIANINTPGYKSRDLSPEAFQASLKKALVAPPEEPSPGEAALLRSGPGLTTSEASAPDRPGRSEDLSGVDNAMKSLLFHDDSDVSLEKQITEISKNQAMHNMAVALMQTQFRQLRSAISENVT